MAGPGSYLLGGLARISWEYHRRVPKCLVLPPDTLDNSGVRRPRLR